MKAFFKSKWFERMWVLLEYLVSKTVHPVTSDYRIFLYEDGPAIVTFSELWGFFTDRKGHLLESKAVDTHSRFQAVRHQILRETTLTYAQAFSLIADEQCSYHRDRFLALCGFLDLQASSWTSSSNMLAPSLIITLFLGIELARYDDDPPYLERETKILTPNSEDSLLPAAASLHSIPLWIQAVLRLGTRFVRVAASSVPTAAIYGRQAFRWRQYV